MDIESYIEYAKNTSFSSLNSRYEVGEDTRYLMKRIMSNDLTVSNDNPILTSVGNIWVPTNKSETYKLCELSLKTTGVLKSNEKSK